MWQEDYAHTDTGAKQFSGKSTFCTVADLSAISTVF